MIKNCSFKYLILLMLLLKLNLTISSSGQKITFTERVIVED